MTPTPGSIPGQGQVSHYQLLELLGQGAMGEVWLAEDTRLPRKVALKLLPAHLAADPDAVERLLREARAAASVDHPGVVTVYDAGVESGRPFLAMQRVEGRTLEERLVEGPLPITEAVDMARQIADALAEVHALGIVHRDLKPSNLILTPRGVKILDFGVASVKGAVGLTSAGSTVGSPVTMSPEQLIGQPADNRSDLWSLGVILYRSITGVWPFAGESFESVAYQVINEQPRVPSRLNPEVGHDLDFMVMKLLRKEPAGRYSRAEELLSDLSNCEACLTSGAPGASEAERFPGLAVMPFEVLSSDPDDAYLAAGLMEDLIVDLMRVEGVRVASRSEVLAYKDRSLPPRTLGRELGVEYLLQGSVRRAGNRARISAQLARAQDGHTLWAERFDRTLEDLFDVQAEVSRKIVEALQIRLQPGERELLERAPTSDPEGYRFYLRSLELLGAGGLAKNREAEALLKLAISRDPGFALAYAAVADAYSIRAWSGIGGAETADAALDYARRALELSPDLPGAYIARARVHFVRGEGAQLLENLGQVASRNPDRPESLEWTGWAYNVMGKPELSLAPLTKAFEGFPESYAASVFLVDTYHFLGREEDAGRQRWLARERLTDYVQRHPDHAHARSLLATALVATGDGDAAMKQAAMARELAPEDQRVRYNFVCVLSKGGRLPEAMRELESLYIDGPTSPVAVKWYKRDPDLAAVRTLPRFTELFGGPEDEPGEAPGRTSNA